MASGGLGDPANTTAETLTGFDSRLYLTTDNPTTGCEVWKTSDGTTWVRANQDGNVGPVHAGHGGPKGKPGRKPFPGIGKAKSKKLAALIAGIGAAALVLIIVILAVVLRSGTPPPRKTGGKTETGPGPGDAGA
mgnify:CR=1 FL=1